MLCQLIRSGMFVVHSLGIELPTLGGLLPASGDPHCSGLDIADDSKSPPWMTFFYKCGIITYRLMMTMFFRVEPGKPRTRGLSLECLLFLRGHASQPLA